MNVQEDDIMEISRKLSKMTDGAKSMDDAVELVTALENMRVNIDLLTKTRIGAGLNEFRKKIKDEKLAKRCKALIKKWEVQEENSQQRKRRMEQYSDDDKKGKEEEKRKEKPSFVPSGKLAEDTADRRSVTDGRGDSERRERQRGREREHHRHHRDDQHSHHRRNFGQGEEPPPGGWDKPKWDLVKKEEEADEEAKLERQNNASDNNKEQEKEKPSFVPSGKLAEDTNTYKGVVIKYNEPPEAKLPKLRWRIYPFKGDEQLPVFYVHRQSAYLIGRDRKIADFPIDHPSCSKQHAALQYRSLPYERSDGSVGRRTRPYIIDLGSGNGTVLNGDRIEAQRYYELKEKDVLRFGFSLREYVMLHEQSAATDADEEEDTSAEEEDDVKGELIDRTGGEERMAAAEEDELF